MAEMIGNSTDYLLESGLNTLHRQTKDWISEALLWKDEIRFFKNLISKKILEEYAKARFAEIRTENEFFLKEFESAIDTFYQDWLEQFYKVLNTHENYLAGLLANHRNENDQAYREKHRSISEKFEGLRRELVKLKLHLFRYVEGLNINIKD